MLHSNEDQVWRFIPASHLTNIRDIMFSYIMEQNSKNEVLERCPSPLRCTYQGSYSVSASLLVAIWIYFFPYTMIYKDGSECQIRLLTRSNDHSMFVHEGLRGSCTTLAAVLAEMQYYVCPQQQWILNLRREGLTFRKILPFRPDLERWMGILSLPTKLSSY